MLMKKKWYKSKTVWASVVSLLIAVLSAAYGETSPIVAMAVTIFSSLGIYGRVTAQEELK